MLVTDSAATVLRRFAPMIYGPTLLFAVGEGAVLPLLPVLAAQLGADIATAALVASALVVGPALRQPAGRVGRRPHRRTPHHGDRGRRLARRRRRA